MPDGQPLDALDKALINALQDGIPVCERPFELAAERLGIDEETLLRRVQTLLERKTLSRFGPMFDAQRLGGAFTLCAMEVPERRFDEIADIVNAFPEVAHNYQRDHRFNMWFVVAAESNDRMNAVLEAIGNETGLDVINLPKLDEYFIGLRFEA